MAVQLVVKRDKENDVQVIIENSTELHDFFTA
jgi:hypothetical protein